MYIPVKLAFCIFALFVSAQHVAAEEWRGIVPLRSTREDVVRLFGECSDQPSSCSFTLPNEEVLIVFARDFCPEGATPETVLMIERQLQKGTTLATLGLDKQRFKTFKPWYPGDTSYRAYIDEKSGLLLASISRSWRMSVHGLDEAVAILSYIGELQQKGDLSRPVPNCRSDKS